MIVVADIGNSRVHIGFYRDGNKITSMHCSSLARTEDEWVMMTEHFCARNGLRPEEAEGSVIGSVVPSLTGAVTRAFTRLFSARSPLIVGHGIRTGLDIRTDRQSELGADIVANAIAARAKFQPPFIIADFGTATTFSAVDGEDRFRGVSIFPGLTGAAQNLRETCAYLPEVPLLAPRELLGKNTEDAVSGGLINGFAALAEGMMDRIAEEYGFSDPVRIVCGGAAPAVLSACKAPVQYLPDLTLDGLARLYEINRKK